MQWAQTAVEAFKELLGAFRKLRCQKSFFIAKAFCSQNQSRGRQYRETKAFRRFSFRILSSFNDFKLSEFVSGLRIDCDEKNRFVD
jgi:hypothetical protein